MKQLYRLPTHSWTVERTVFLMAGFFVLGSVLLGHYHSAYWFYFTGFMGGMMMFFAITGLCPMAIILQKICNLNSLANHK